MSGRRGPTSHEGVSVPSTVVILFTILLVSAGMLYIWRSMQERTGRGIMIQSVKFEESSTHIYAQNVGTVTLTIWQVHINDEKFDIDSTNCIVGSQSTTRMQQGQTAKIIIDQSYEIWIHIKVVCEDGTYNEADYHPLG